ncbi:hypothetical protein SVAN01_09794 [Stagonosporopsis vannaccii]|nr:hypothetical protein SVAN01_09794 [Stagonosporopsis vannaccii]
MTGNETARRDRLELALTNLFSTSTDRLETNAHRRLSQQVVCTLDDGILEAELRQKAGILGMQCVWAHASAHCFGACDGCTNSICTATHVASPELKMGVVQGCLQPKRDVIASVGRREQEQFGLGHGGRDYARTLPSRGLSVAKTCPDACSSAQWASRLASPGLRLDGSLSRGRSNRRSACVWMAATADATGWRDSGSSFSSAQDTLHHASAPARPIRSETRLPARVRVRVLCLVMVTVTATATATATVTHLVCAPLSRVHANRALCSSRCTTASPDSMEYTKIALARSTSPDLPGRAILRDVIEPATAKLLCSVSGAEETRYLGLEEDGMSLSKQHSAANTRARRRVVRLPLHNRDVLPDGTASSSWSKHTSARVSTMTLATRVNMISASALEQSGSSLDSTSTSADYASAKAERHGTLISMPTSPFHEA